jgi:hypothetical protein
MLVGFLLPTQPVTGQVVWRDLVFTGGVSAEAYRGDFSAITVTAVDSTDEASAAVGEFGIRGSFLLFSREERSVGVQFDTGLRQFMPGGFKVRDYAPREIVGRVDLSYREALGTLGELQVIGGAGARNVDDRPPMPLFIQPGYGTMDGRMRLELHPIDGVVYDAQVFGELADYGTTNFTTQLALLDRRVLGVEVGATWAPSWRLRGHLGFRASKYPNQGTFDPDDPLRRDKTFKVGATWTLRSSFLAQIGVEGTVNRSNSKRPEYEALGVQAVVSMPLPYELGLNFFADLTAKRYLKKSGFAQLVPGEEADNASVVYLELTRPLFTNLDGAVRFGWTRAEENIGNSYFQRLGASVLFRYRPFE